jgi:hypothetical protein
LWKSSQVAASNPRVFDYSSSTDALRKIVQREGAKVESGGGVVLWQEGFLGG